MEQRSSVAAVYENGKVLFADIAIDAPRGREALVAVQQSGVCHSDLAVVDGASRAPSDRPVVLGHEGAGVVVAVGLMVTYARPGMRVIACPSAFCGECEDCLTGRPNLCKSGALERPVGMPPRLSRHGRPAWPFIEMGSLSEYMLVHENALVEIPDVLGFSEACVLGCGALTGYGAVFRTAGVAPGDAVAVIGCGGVGLAAVQAARVSGAAVVLAVDVNPRALERAEGCGATNGVLPEHAVQVARELTRGRGVRHAIEATGSRAAMRQAVELLAPGGTATLVGVPPPGSDVAFPWLPFRMECRVQSSRMGSNRFRVDVPVYAALAERGLLSPSSLIGDSVPFTEGGVARAFDTLRSGGSGRTVVQVGVRP